MLTDPLRALFKHGNHKLRENLALQDPMLASELTAIWASACKKIYGFEVGKRLQGALHNLAVENNIGILLEHFNLLDKMKAKDIFVLSAAAALHDIDKAMIKYGKGYNHGRSGNKLLLKDRVRLEFSLDPRKAEAVAHIIDVHSDGNLDRIPEGSFVIVDPPGLNLRGLAAIFRLGDILDTTYERHPDVILRVRGVKSKDEEKVTRATRLIGGWTPSGDGKAIVLQVIRHHKIQDELALLAFADDLNAQVTASHKKYLENCPVICSDGKSIVMTLPSRFELEQSSLRYKSGGLKEFHLRILARYLHKLHSAMMYVDLGGLGVFKEKAKTPLSKIFINLKCRRSYRYKSLPLYLRNYDFSRKNAKKNDTKTIDKLIAFNEVPVSELLKDEKLNYLVLLGHAGSGKSTVAQYMCLSLADPKRGVTAPIPFVIPIRIFISERTKKNCDYSFVDYILDEVNIRIFPMTCPKSFVEYFLKEKKSIIILDGLDEVTKSEERKAVCATIHDFVNKFGDARLIVTSRIYGYEEAPISWAGFLHVELCPVEQMDVEKFIRSWYVQREPDQRRREEKIENFNLARKDKTVEQLASSPLMLTIMALVNEKGELPRLRTELYNTLITAYLENREEMKGLLWYDRAEIRSAHEHLGYWMQSKFEKDPKQKEVTVDELEQSLLEFLSRRSHFPREEQAQKVRETIDLARKRIGLIVENKFGGFSFALKPVQEYFAASYINAHTYGMKQLWKSIGKKVFKPYWHEVMKFLAGMMVEQARNELIARVLKERNEGLMLASEIAVERIPINVSLLLRISKECFMKIMEPLKEHELEIFFKFLAGLLNTDARNFTLEQFTRVSSTASLKGLDLLVSVTSLRALTSEELTSIARSLTTPWEGPLLRDVCRRIFAELGTGNTQNASTFAFVLNVAMEIAERRNIVKEEAKGLRRGQVMMISLGISEELARSIFKPS